MINDDMIDCMMLKIEIVLFYGLEYKDNFHNDGRKFKWQPYPPLPLGPQPTHNNYGTLGRHLQKFRPVQHHTDHLQRIILQLHEVNKINTSHSQHQNQHLRPSGNLLGKCRPAIRR